MCHSRGAEWEPCLSLPEGRELSSNLRATVLNFSSSHSHQKAPGSGLLIRCAAHPRHRPLHGDVTIKGWARAAFTSAEVKPWIPGWKDYTWTCHILHLPRNGWQAYLVWQKGPVWLAAGPALLQTLLDSADNRLFVQTERGLRHPTPAHHKPVNNVKWHWRQLKTLYSPKH